MENKGFRVTRIDAGLLVLRFGAGLFLVATFGWRKFLGYAVLVHSGQPMANVGLAPLIKTMGFPFPVFLGFYATFCESIGALLVACGFLTRLASFMAALSMTGAFYVSMRLHEEPLRAVLYLVMFTALVWTGPGKFSIDYLLQSAAKRKLESGPLK
ncbi:MAG TPA: DoxX family protein [Candidatus Angelobacter sp.]|jgi:putative oxidoreductase